MIRILPYETLGKEAVLARTEEAPDVSAPVSAILAAVKEEGDSALRRYVKEFDGMGDETPLEVSKE